MEWHRAVVTFGSMLTYISMQFCAVLLLHKVCTMTALTLTSSCALALHVHLTSRYYPAHDKFTRLSFMLVLQATNVGRKGQGTRLLMTCLVSSNLKVLVTYI